MQPYVLNIGLTLFNTITLIDLIRGGWRQPPHW